jgi:hypothetical protein
MDRGPDICPHTIFVTVDAVSEKLIEGLTEALMDGYEHWVVIPVGPPLAVNRVPVTVVPK